MANFSKVIKDHNEMRRTIIQLEAVKKRIKASVREQNPPDEFALRNNMSAIGQSGFEGNEIVDDVVADTGIMSVEILLKTLFRGIESTLLNPRNANDLWMRINRVIRQDTARIATAHANLTSILSRLSPNTSFSTTDTAQIKVSIERLLGELFPNNPQPPNVNVLNQYFMNPNAAGPDVDPEGSVSNVGSNDSSSFSLATPSMNSVSARPEGQVSADWDSLNDGVPNDQTGASPSMAEREESEYNTPAAGLSQQDQELIRSILTANREGIRREEDIEAGVDPDDVPAVRRISPSTGRDVLLQILNSRTILQNNTLGIDKKTLDDILNMLSRNMDLTRTGVRQLRDRMNYDQWARIIYLAAIMYDDDQFLEELEAETLSMKSTVEKLVVIQNRITGSENLSKPDKDFLQDFFFSSDDQYRNMRGQIYESQVPVRILGTPVGETPSKIPEKKSTSTAKKMQNLAQRLFTPSKPKAETPGAKSGRGLKHTGLKTVKQIISRTENLIQAANLGNKSPEVRNELDTLLAVLIDRKEVRPQFRTNLMKKLF